MDAKELSLSLIQTVVDQEHWQTALEELQKFTGASKILLSLRDLRTSEIVIPEKVSNTFTSPLISGFKDEEVGSYLGHYVAEDPWTAVEQQNYPYFPYEMSRYLPKSKLRKTAFWQWLNPQGIDDCIVCDLGRTDDHWTALNLYFDGSRDPNKAQDIIRRLRSVLPELKVAWASGRTFQIAKASEVSRDMVLAALPTPAVLIERDGTVFSVNDACKDVFAKIGHPIRVGAPLHLPSDMSVTSAAGLGRIPIGRGPVAGLNMQTNIAMFQSAELAGGELRNLILVTIAPNQTEATPDGSLIWEAEGLTDRERTLVRLVAQGQKFREAQVEMGISYQRIMQLWRSSREKLGMEDVTELRLTHKLSQI